MQDAPHGRPVPAAPPATLEESCLGPPAYTQSEGAFAEIIKAPLLYCLSAIPLLSHGLSVILHEVPIGLTLCSGWPPHTGKGPARLLTISLMQRSPWKTTACWWTRRFVCLSAMHARTENPHRTSGRCHVTIWTSLSHVSEPKTELGGAWPGSLALSIASVHLGSCQLYNRGRADSLTRAIWQLRTCTVLS